jgi:DNA invertase Pin-like site-specific DNA recombinase
VKAAIYARVSTLDQHVETSSKSCADMPRSEVGLRQSSLTMVFQGRRTAGQRLMRC